MDINERATAKANVNFNRAEIHFMFHFLFCCLTTGGPLLLYNSFTLCCNHLVFTRYRVALFKGIFMLLWITIKFKVKKKIKKVILTGKIGNAFRHILSLLAAFCFLCSINCSPSLIHHWRCQEFSMQNVRNCVRQLNGQPD